ncbi:hypothetical protein SLS54_010153 [Diplodia seriata]
MFEVELDRIGPQPNDLSEQGDNYLNTNPPEEQLGDAELQPLVEQPTTLVPEQQQSSRGNSVPAGGQVLKISPAAAIGQSGITMLSISTIIIVAAMALLAYLWAKQKDTSTAGHLWRLVVVGSWLPQVITLCTLALRWATAVQLCIFTSMLASVAVESYQVTLSQVMAVSVMRATSAEPPELLWALLQGNRYILWGIRTIALTTMLMLLQTSFQFSSTILLSDLHPGLVRGDAAPREVRYGLSDVLKDKLGSDAMGNPWNFKPPSWPSFAEFSEPAVEADGLKDTGFVLRALLPLEAAQSRLTVGNYSGLATVLPSRVACFRPPLSNLTIGLEVSAGFISGKIDFGEVQFALLGGCQSRPCREMTEPTQGFNCTLNYGTQAEPREWATTLCVVQESLGKYEFSRTSSPYFGTGYLLLNSTGAMEEWFFGGGQSNGSWTNLTLSDTAEWTTVDMPFAGGHVSATLCYYNQGPLNHYDVSASRAGGAAEPRFKWDANSAQFDTADVQKQLGVDMPVNTHQDRGILTLADWQEPADRPSHAAPLNQLLDDQSNGASYTLCQHCVRADADATSVHRTLITLFQDIFVATANPALALQALFTTVSQMNYYSLLSEFDRARNASVTPFVTVSVPQRWTGFAAVAGLVIAHFICGALVMLLFLKKCRCSMLGQLWRCIAQIRSGDTDVVLKKASVATDDDIRVWLKEHGKGETRVGVLPWRRRGTTESA